MDRTWARHAVPLQRARKSMVSTGRKTASGTRPCNSSIYGASETVQPFQYRKRYSPVQPQMTAWYVRIALFQYRKRYSPVQRRTRRRTGRGYHVSIPQAVFACATDGHGSHQGAASVSIPQAVFACVTVKSRSVWRLLMVSIPQAVFACVTRNCRWCHPRYPVSIPQAVFACVTAYPLKPRGC